MVNGRMKPELMLDDDRRDVVLTCHVPRGRMPEGEDGCLPRFCEIESEESKEIIFEIG